MNFNLKRNAVTAHAPRRRGRRGDTS